MKKQGRNPNFGLDLQSIMLKVPPKLVPEETKKRAKTYVTISYSGGIKLKEVIAMKMYSKLCPDTGVSVPVCEACIKGKHTFEGGRLFDHRDGLPDRGDCKNVGFLNDGVVQCACGLGGYVYNPKTDKLEKKGGE